MKQQLKNAWEWLNDDGDWPTSMSEVKESMKDIDVDPVVIALAGIKEGSDDPSEIAELLKNRK